MDDYDYYWWEQRYDALLYGDHVEGHPNRDSPPAECWFCVAGIE